MNSSLDHEGHAHTDSEQHASDVGGQRFAFAVAVNLAFAMFEGAVALYSNSASLLADAGHNLGDVTGLLLAWGATYLAGIKSSRTYSYGYRRSTILAAIINSLILVFTAAIIAFESVHKLQNPVDMAELPVMLVAGVGILVNGVTALVLLRGAKQDLNVRAAFLHLAYDGVVSLGVVLSAAVVYWTDWQVLDPLAGITIALVILLGAWGVLRDSVNLILDAVPAHLEVEEVRQWLRQLDGVSDVHDVHIWGMSTRETVMTAHLVMPGNELWRSENGFTEISRELKRRFRIHHVTLQVERDQECDNEKCCD